MLTPGAELWRDACRLGPWVYWAKAILLSLPKGKHHSEALSLLGLVHSQYEVSIQQNMWSMWKKDVSQVSTKRNKQHCLGLWLLWILPPCSVCFSSCLFWFRHLSTNYINIALNHCPLKERAWCMWAKRCTENLCHSSVVVWVSVYMFLTRFLRKQIWDRVCLLGLTGVYSWNKHLWRRRWGSRIGQ
jgi:hypothetical protein